ncbi:hypothetical protein B0O99DRAFT_676412 [Bisporella sp. PMI_857]|nr:hypothetical protein B0O99DRAFT_676412 [Bisporella sp. PMI_857]
MRDDTMGDEVNQIQFSSNIDEIIKHQTHRKHAARWARNLRFLTFNYEDTLEANDTNVDGEIIDVLKKGQCTRCETRVLPSAGHICSAHGSQGGNRDYVKQHEQQLRDFAYPCIHVTEKTCDDCRAIPLFPTTWKVTKFRIRRLRPKGTKTSRLANCTHFLAVSYCWSSQNNRKTNRLSDQANYQVVEENGRIRSIRAPKDVIDRSVAFAVQNGFRMIWIDQECIEQDDEREKEIGIQAMDLVYLKAHTSIGLFNARFIHQRHLDALFLFFEWELGSSMQRRGPRPLKECRTLHLDILAEAVSMVINDRWNTRAWILQEAFSSGRNMILLFPRGKNIDLSGWSLICHDSSLTEMAIRLDIVRQCLSQSRSFFTSSQYRHVKIKDPEWHKTLETLRWFHPKPKPSHSVDVWVNENKPRRTCNAAVAMSFLKSRQNDRVADRLAIIANLCDYSLRLNTSKLEASNHSLSVCIHLLAMMNGDFSLLSPEAYSIPRKPVPIEPRQNDSDFSWVSVSIKRPLKFIDADVFNPSGPTIRRNNPLMYSLSKKGFALPSVLWKIDEFVDMTPIQERYRESWDDLQTSYKRQSRKISIAAKKEQSVIDRGTVETARNHWLATTHLLFEIISFLRESNNVSVADAIWQSVMNVHWRRDNVVESTLNFQPHLKLENRKNMFHLEKTNNVGFHSWWLIDRIMYKGGLWVGRVEDSERFYTGFEPHLENTLEELPEIKQTLDERRGEQDQGKPSGNVVAGSQGYAATDIRILSSDGGARTATARHSVEVTHSSENPEDLVTSLPDRKPSKRKQKKDRTDFSKKSHAERQFIGSLFWQITEAMAEMMDNNSGDEKDDSLGSLYTPSEAVSSFARAVAYWNVTTGKGFKEQRRAVFDIDGDENGSVLVLTPFNENFETIPRPEIRSMSVSWVVERDDSLAPVLKDENKQRNIEETLRAKGMVRGMWTFMMNPIIKYNLV